MPAPAVVAIYRTVSEQLTAQFGAAQVQILADPMKVAPTQYSTYCSLVVAMFRAISTLPPEQSGAVMSQILSGNRTNKR